MGLRFWLNETRIGITETLIKNYKGELLDHVPRMSEVPEDKFLVLVVYGDPGEEKEMVNLVFRDSEIEAWETDPADFRKREWVMADKRLLIEPSNIDFCSLQENGLTFYSEKLLKILGPYKPDF